MAPGPARTGAEGRLQPSHTHGLILSALPSAAIASVPLRPSVASHPCALHPHTPCSPRCLQAPAPLTGTCSPYLVPALEAPFPSPPPPTACLRTLAARPGAAQATAPQQRPSRWEGWPALVPHPYPSALFPKGQAHALLGHGSSTSTPATFPTAPLIRGAATSSPFPLCLCLHWSARWKVQKDRDCAGGAAGVDVTHFLLLTGLQVTTWLCDLGQPLLTWVGFIHAPLGKQGFYTSLLPVPSAPGTLPGT